MDGSIDMEAPDGDTWKEDIPCGEEDVGRMGDMEETTWQGVESGETVIMKVKEDSSGKMKKSKSSLS